MASNLRKSKVGIGTIYHMAYEHGFREDHFDRVAPEDDFPDMDEDEINYPSDAEDSEELRLTRAADFSGKEIPEQAFVVEGFLIAGVPISIYGAGGIGKSMLALQLTACISTSTDFMGYKTNKKKCLIVSCEDDHNEIHRRLDRIRKHYDLEYDDFGDNLVFCCRAGEDNLLVSYPNGNGKLEETGFFKSLKKIIHKHEFEFIVIDNIANVFGGDENDRVDTAQFLSHIYRLCHKRSITVLLLGHPNKSGDKYSGSTAWDAAVRQRFTIFEKDNHFILQCSKANYLAKGHEIQLLKTDEGIFMEAYEHREDPQADEIDFELLKDRIYELIKHYNITNDPISFSRNAAPYYAKKFRLSGELKDYRAKEVHMAVEELRAEGKIKTDGKTQKIIAT